MLRTDQEQELVQIEENIRETLTKFNQENKKLYQLSFSIGHSMYYPEASTDSFLNEMDNNMYEEKKGKHSRSSFKITESPA